MLHETTQSNNDIHSFANDNNNNSETTQSEIIIEMKEIRISFMDLLNFFLGVIIHMLPHFMLHFLKNELLRL